MPVKLYYLNSILCVSILMGCSSAYVPQTRNVPLFTKAGEFQGTIQSGILSANVQTAFAITNHFAIMANGAYGNYHANPFTLKTSQFVSQKSYEGAIGYYNNRKSNTICFEIFAGYGRGEGSAHDYDLKTTDQNDFAIKGKYIRYMLQPTIGFRFLRTDIVQLACTARCSYVDFTEETILNHNGLQTNNPPSTIFFEPATTVKFNFFDNRFFFSVQGGLFLSLDHSSFASHDSSPIPSLITLSGGLGIRLGGLRFD